MNARALVTSIALSACVSSAVSERAVDSDPPPPPPPAEICNGEDDDLDGEVDEGFADVDQDGVADCVDTRCRLPEPQSVEVRRDPDCPVQPRVASGAWDLVQQWHWGGLAEDPAVRQVMGAAVVGPLIDTDGDGRLTRGDTPSVAAVAFAEGRGSDGTLVVLDGVTGELQWSAPGFTSVGSLSLGDIDGDGWPEIVGFGSDSTVLAYRGDGQALWAGPAADRSNAPMSALADLDGDGSIEVLADDLVLDGVDGRLLARLDATSGGFHRGPSTVDLDGDGQQEILFGTQVFDRSGALLWEADLSSARGTWGAPVEGRSEGVDVVFVADRTIERRSGDGGGRVNRASVLASPVTGPICVADFDGDDEREIVFASQARLCMFELEGRERWCINVRDRSGLAGCSAFDFDDDGAADVLYASETSFIIVNGPSGGLRFEDREHSSGTLIEHPVVADIDDDGSAEVVVSSNDAWFGTRAGLTAWTHRADGLAPSTRVVGQHASAAGDRRSNGWISRRLSPGSGVRSRPSAGPEDQDLQITADGVCAASCEADGRVRVRVQVHNSGKRAVAEGVPLSVYAVDGPFSQRILTASVPEAIPSGSSVSLVVDVTAGELGQSLEVRIDDDGSPLDTVRECDESNNRAVYLELPCR